MGDFGPPNFPIFPAPPPEQTVIIQIDPLSGILAGILAVVVHKLETLIQAHNALSAAVGVMFALQTQTSRSIWSILKSILGDVLHLHFVKALHDLTDLVQKIQGWARKLKGWLDKYKQMRRQHDLAVRKLLNLMQRVRKILVPLRILHIKFAQKLDGWLAGIEGRIITREHLIVGKTNEIIAWIDLITNAGGGIHGWAVAGGVGRMYGALQEALLAAGVENVFPWVRRVYRDPIPARPFSDWSAPFFKLAESSPSAFEDFQAGVLETYRRAKEEMQT